VIGQVELFAAPAAAKHAEEIERLVPVVRRLALAQGSYGVTVSDLRFVAAREGLVPNVGIGRQLSYLGAVMRAAGLTPTGERRRSIVPQAHGNLNTVWRVPEGAT
jgi:hypothetical protein